MPPPAGAGGWRRLPVLGQRRARAFVRIGGSSDRIEPDMIELNPVRQRIADLTGRLDSLRGYL